MEVTGCGGVLGWGWGVFGNVGGWMSEFWTSGIVYANINFKHAYVACRSETCAILKHVSDWHSVPF